MTGMYIDFSYVILYPQRELWSLFRLQLYLVYTMSNEKTMHKFTFTKDIYLQVIQMLPGLKFHIQVVKAITEFWKHINTAMS